MADAEGLSMSYRHVIGLHSNARAFAESAVEYARRGNAEEWKFAVLHLTTALELLLKAKLAASDHRLLVVGKSQITERQFDEGDFKSVGMDECLERLEQRCGFALNSRQIQVLKTLRNLRNRVAHYIDPGGSPAIKAASAAGLNLFIEIDNREFCGEDPYRARSIRELVVDLHACEEFVRERLAAVTEKLHGAARPRTHHLDECSYCLQDATVIDGGSVKCLFCGHENSVAEYAELISEDGSVDVCPTCGRESLARHQWHEAKPTFECFCCGYFTGPEMRWSDGKNPIPRLHTDR